MSFSLTNNPYANSLDGLVLADPITAFFNFCLSREEIRIRRKNNQPPPWSSDVIFQRGRFLNVFREDDKVTSSILKMAHGVVGREGVRSATTTAAPTASLLLLRTLFFARWCNRHSTLEAISAAWVQTYCHDTSANNQSLRSALTTSLTSPPPWDNVTAYPVGPIQWCGKSYSRFDAATLVFAREDVQIFLLDCIHKSQGNVVDATRRINLKFQMNNNFPIFMAVMDIAWFRPDLIHPHSPVPVGIGAVPFLVLLEKQLGLDIDNKTLNLDHLDQRGNVVFQELMRLQPMHWPDAKRELQPIDCEYLCCECRKYYSYVNGTKKFSGKNIFVPGKSARLEFDVPPTGLLVNDIEKQDRIVVIAGAPCSGKSTLVAELRARGFTCHRETAEVLLSAGIAAGSTVEDMRRDAVAWQMELMEQDFALFQGLLGTGGSSGSSRSLVFTDTSFVETVVFSRRAGIEISPNVATWLLEEWRGKVIVFFLEPLPVELYETTGVRMESGEVSRQISEEHRAAYAEFGMELIEVPPVSVAERVALILRKVGGQGSRL